MAVALATVLMCALEVTAKSSSRKSTGKSEKSEKSVYVHSYTRKDGTQVRAHYRRPPGTTTHDPAPREARSTSASPVPYERDHVASGYTLHPSVARDSHGRIKRSNAAKDAFKREQPCPSTGKPSGSCPGYVIDHVKPLECGGADDPSNMQWQTIAEGKAKDKTERYCH
jgi:hypothetical protein